MINIHKVKEKVTPLQVTIENNHGSPIRFSYALFSLTDPSGLSFAALPPYSISGTIEEKDVSNFSCPGFYVAPYYSPFYPNLNSYDDDFDYDYSYFDHYYSCWKDVSLPTQEMLDVALPEGVLKNGAKVTGFLYFEKVGEAKSYNFNMKLVDDSDGNIFGNIVIPFEEK